MDATPFLRAAQISKVVNESASQADAKQACGKFVSSCLPSRLSRVRISSPAFSSHPSFSTRFAGSFRASNLRKHFETAVLFCAKRRSTNICLRFRVNTCLAFHLLTKVFTTCIGRLLATGIASQATIEHLFVKYKGGRCSLGGSFQNSFRVTYL
jgi:hypothetical protein